MIVDCISDLHGYFPELQGGDLLIVAGDLTAKHEGYEFVKFRNWLNKQKYSKKIVIAGNHDGYIVNNTWMDKEIDEFDYLLDSGTEFEGLKIWGSPWTKNFKGQNSKCKAFGLDTEEELATKWALIPDDTDILITHSPPYGVLDWIHPWGDKDKRDLLGSPSLLNRIDQIKPKLHVFGHIHEHGGQQFIYKRPGYGDENNTICVNASIVNERYEHVNKRIRMILSVLD